MTNIEWMTEIASYGSPMKQMFMIDAITKYAEAVSELTDEEIEEQQEKSPFISMSAWRESAREIMKSYNETFPKR